MSIHICQPERISKINYHMSIWLCNGLEGIIISYIFCISNELFSHVKFVHQIDKRYNVHSFSMAIVYCVHQIMIFCHFPSNAIDSLKNKPDLETISTKNSFSLHHSCNIHINNHFNCIISP